MAVRVNDPTLYRRRLRSDVRRAREGLGMSHRDVAEAMDWSVSKLIRIEAGAVTITTNDLRALVAHYGITDPRHVEELIDLAKRSRERSPWWVDFRDIAPPELLASCGYESSAKVIRNFQPLLVPGLLQTEEYADDLLRYIRGPKNARRLDGLVKLRLQRQELLNSPDGPSLHFIVDEAVVRRVVGGPGVMRKQLSHMKEIAQRPNVTLRIVPFGQGWYRGLRAPYIYYEFDDPQDEAILYLETLDGGAAIVEEATATAVSVDEDEGTATPAIYLEMFWELEQVASPELAYDLLDEAIHNLSTAPVRVDLATVESRPASPGGTPSKIKGTSAAVAAGEA
jgi:transcriptional regulator with XRE-family HTH domain